MSGVGLEALALGVVPKLEGVIECAREDVFA